LLLNFYISEIKHHELKWWKLAFLCKAKSLLHEGSKCANPISQDWKKNLFSHFKCYELSIHAVKWVEIFPTHCLPIKSTFVPLQFKKTIKNLTIYFEQCIEKLVVLDFFLFQNILPVLSGLIQRLTKVGRGAIQDNFRGSFSRFRKGPWLVSKREADQTNLQVWHSDMGSWLLSWTFHLSLKIHPNGRTGSGTGQCINLSFFNADL